MAAPTLQNAKEWIGIASSSSDSLIQRCLDAATKTVSEHVGTTIGSARTEWRNVPLNALRLILTAETYGEFEGITQLHLRGINSDGAAVAVSATSGYTLMQTDSWEMIVRLTEGLWDSFEAASPGGAAIDTSLPVQIAFTGGLAPDDVPDDWAMCILQLTAEAFQNRGDMPARKRVSEVYLSQIAPRCL